MAAVSGRGLIGLGGTADRRTGRAVILVADATPNGPMANLRNWVFDAYERSWPASRPENRILVIDIDGGSIRHIGQWPWSRDQLARLMETAAVARVIGIDLLLTEPDRLSGNSHETDAILAASTVKSTGHRQHTAPGDREVIC